MKVLGIRHAQVSDDAEALAAFFDALGLLRRSLADVMPPSDSFVGAIFPAGSSWIELWPTGPGMPVGTMVQVIVDDADAFAAHARANGLEPEGPMDAHGEHIYMLKGPGGLQVSFQSALGTPSP